MLTLSSSSTEKFYLSEEYYSKLHIIKTNKGIYHIKSLPEGSIINEDVDFEDYEFEHLVLPKNLTIKGDCILRKCPIIEIQQNLHVKNHLDLRFSFVKKINPGLKCESLDVSQSDIEEISGIQVKEDIQATHTNNLRNISDIKVGGSINLNYSQIEYLPDNLTVFNLKINSTNIKELPKRLRVRGDLFMSATKIDVLPEDLRVEGKVFGFKGDKTIYPNLTFAKLGKVRQTI